MIQYVVLDAVGGVFFGLLALINKFFSLNCELKRKLVGSKEEKDYYYKAYEDLKARYSAYRAGVIEGRAGTAARSDEVKV